MKQFVLLALAMVVSAMPTYAQFVTKDTVSPASGCSSPYTYDNGVNIVITVLSGSAKTDKAGLARTMAQDISRFKDTGRIRASNDALPPTDRKPIEFMVTIILDELKLEGGETSGYAAAMFTMEQCASFANSNSKTGFAVDMITASPHLFVDPTKEGLVDSLEKEIYDSLIAIVRSRRAKIK